MGAKPLIILSTIASMAIAAGRAPVRTIDGKRVRIGAALRAEPLLELKGLRLYQAQNVETGSDETVVAGLLVSHLPSSQYVVTVEIDLSRTVHRTERMFLHGTAKAVIERPKPGYPVKFYALGPPCFDHSKDAENTTQHHNVRLSFTDWRPPAPKP